MEEKQVLTVSDRNSLTLNTVLCIAGFDDEYVKLKTGSGEVEIGGKELKVTDLSKEKKTVSVEGCIRQIVFAEKSDKPKSFFGGKIR